MAFRDRQTFIKVLRNLSYGNKCLPADIKEPTQAMKVFLRNHAPSLFQSPVQKRKFSKQRRRHLVPVAQRVDSAIHWITQLVLLLFIRWITIYPLDSVIRLLNNRGQRKRLEQINMSTHAWNKFLSFFLFCFCLFVCCFSFNLASVCLSLTSSF